jgi:predicted outer membrane repeat protein
MNSNSYYSFWLRKSLVFIVILLVSGLILYVEPLPTVQAATFTIADGDIAGLVQAINTSNNNGQLSNVINLASAGNYTFNSAFNASPESALPTITSNLVINGNGARIRRNTASGTPQFGLIAVGKLGNVTINNLILSDANDINAEGGGALLNSGGIVNLTNCTFSSNYALIGGAIVNFGTMNIVDCTFSNNSTPQYGGAISNERGASLTINSSTFVGNKAGLDQSFGYGGAISNTNYDTPFDRTTSLVITNSTFVNNSSLNTAGTIYNYSSGDPAVLTVTHSTFFANSAINVGGIYHGSSTGSVKLLNTLLVNNSGGDCGGTVALTTSVSNLEFPDSTSCGTGSTVSATNPLSGAGLADNGGPTQTIALAPGSNPAIDTANSAYCPTTDQRHMPRPIGIGCDIGAFESSNITPVSPTVSKAFVPFGIASNTTTTLVFTLNNPNSSPLTNVSFNDTLPNQLAVANPTGSTNTCGNGTIVAPAGSTTINISGITLAAKQSCTISMKITGSTIGTYNNTTGPISTNETGTGATSNTAYLKVLNGLIVTTIDDDQNNPPVGSLRAALIIAANQSGAVIIFDPALGNNPQITLTAPLVVPSYTLIEGNCNNKIRINASFANPIQLQGNTWMQGLEIHNPNRPSLKFAGHNNQLRCTTVIGK